MSARQKAFDEGIVWETPATPVTADNFIFQSGKRFVKPYFFEFIAHVKERWDMKTIASLFAEEFRQRPLQYYVHAIESGRILVNGNLVTNEFVVRPSQTLSHFVHRHEPPVMAHPVVILEVNTDVVTVCKPSSVPVHPCGQYRKNTVVGILQAEYNIGPLYPIHRLDRLVSGLLILARNAHTADLFRQEVEINAAITYDAREGRSIVEEAVNLHQELPSKSPEKGSQEGIPNQSLLKGNKSQSHKGKGKHACTRFRKLHTDGVYSIVECMPFTGRTHQIRVHLQYLGHPIANDALYAACNPPSRSERGTNAEQAARAEHICTDEKMACQSVMPKSIPTKSSSKRKRLLEVREESNFCHEGVQGDLSSQTSPSEIDSEAKNVQFMIDPMCTHCPNLSPLGYEEGEDGLWLHCKSYSGKGWNYECPLPKWAEAPPT